MVRRGNSLSGLDSKDVLLLFAAQVGVSLLDALPGKMESLRSALRELHEDVRALVTGGKRNLVVFHLLLSEDRAAA